MNHLIKTKLKQEKLYTTKMQQYPSFHPTRNSIPVYIWSGSGYKLGLVLTRHPTVILFIDSTYKYSVKNLKCNVKSWKPSTTNTMLFRYKRVNFFKKKHFQVYWANWGLQFMSSLTSISDDRWSDLTPKLSYDLEFPKIRACVYHLSWGSNLN